MVAVVLINSIALFLDAFPEFPAGTLVFWIDYACLIYFIAEATLKIRQPGGFLAYWGDPWNRGDFLIVAFSLPLLVSPFLPGHLEHAALLMLLRLGRLPPLYAPHAPGTGCREDLVGRAACAARLGLHLSHVGRSEPDSGHGSQSALWLPPRGCGLLRRSVEVALFPLQGVYHRGLVRNPRPPGQPRPFTGLHCAIARFTLRSP